LREEKSLCFTEEKKRPASAGGGEFGQKKTHFSSFGEGGERYFEKEGKVLPVVRTQGDIFVKKEGRSFSQRGKKRCHFRAEVRLDPPEKEPHKKKKKDNSWRRKGCCYLRERFPPSVEEGKILWLREERSKRNPSLTLRGSPFRGEEKRPNLKEGGHSGGLYWLALKEKGAALL